MRNFFLLFSFLWILGACSDAPVPNEATPASTQAQKASSVPAKMVRDTTPKPKRTKPSQYIKVTSRPKDQIEAKFPFDIDLKQADGNVVKSDAVLQKGKPTIVLFWLTTCGPCRMEMNAIKGKYERWQEEADFNLVAISTDYQKNYPAFVKRVNEQQFPWQSFNDMHREFRQVMPGRLNGLPQTFLFDKNGEIVYHKRKYRPGDEDKLFEEVKKIAG